MNLSEEHFKLMPMKFFCYIILLLVITAIAFFAKHKCFDTKSGINIREVMTIEVEHIYFAEGKTFVEMNVINKTPGPIVFGDTVDSKKQNATI